LFLQEKDTLKEVEAVSPFATGDIMKIMGIGVDEELLLVWDGRVCFVSEHNVR